ncbi:glutaredoxin 3 [Eionea flava]
MSVVIYTTQFCPFCVRAKHLLEQNNVTYKEIAVDHDAALRQEMMSKSGQRTVPQIWINDKHVGGCDDLYALHRSGKLDALLR